VRPLGLWGNVCGEKRLRAGAPLPTPHDHGTKLRLRQGRNGYLKWRSDLKRAHADTVAALMRAAGYEEPSIARVKRMINKMDIKSDAESQVVEDALCLVFMEHQFAELLEKEGPDKVMGWGAAGW